MTARVFFSVVLAVLTSGWSCRMPKGQMLVLNAEASPASFGLSCDDRQTWKPATLEAHARQRYECDRGSGMWVHLNTDLPGEVHQEMEERLKPGRRYEVYFDQTTNKWNLRSLIDRSTCGTTRD